jgi:hypothetical protein
MRFSFWHRHERERELEEELQSHLQMAQRDRMDRGENPQRAQSAAHRDLGNVGLIKEVTRDHWGWRWVGDSVEDLRYGLRSFRRKLPS